MARMFLPRILLPLRPRFNLPQGRCPHLGEFGWRSGKLPADLSARGLGLFAFAQPRVAEILGSLLLTLHALNLQAAGFAMLGTQILQGRAGIIQRSLLALF